MTNERDRLRQTLNQLQAQLDSTDSLDPAVAERSRALVAEVQRALESGDLRPPQRSSLTNRLSESMLEFEGAHPTLSGALGGVIDALARMGIEP